MDMLTAKRIENDRFYPLLELVNSGHPLATGSARQISVFLVIAYARTDNERTVRYIANTLNISKPAVNRAFNGLLRAKLVRRVRDQDDKRNIFLFLTDEGQKMF